MGNEKSTLQDGGTKDKRCLRIVTYNVEWGFIDLPEGITHDSNKNKIPRGKRTQYKHLELCAKNIGLLIPDVCFLQEIGSLKVLKHICKIIESLYGVKYKYYYSNNDIEGIQGVGLLMKENMSSDIEYTVELLPKLRNAIGIIFTYEGNLYKIAGVHLKSFFCSDDDSKKKSRLLKIQEDQIGYIDEWILSGEDADYVVVCGDFNNTPKSSSIKLMLDLKYVDIINTNKYVHNILNKKVTSTGTYKKNNTEKEQNTRLDYIFTTDINICKSIHIINLERSSPDNINNDFRVQNSDHFPLLAVISI